MRGFFPCTRAPMKLGCLLFFSTVRLATPAPAYAWPTNCAAYAEMAADLAKARDQGGTESQAIEQMPTPKGYEASVMFYKLIGEIFESNPRLTQEQASAAARAQCESPDPTPTPVGEIIQDCDAYAELGASMARARDGGASEHGVIESGRLNAYYRNSARFSELAVEIFESSPPPTPEQARALAREQCRATNAPVQPPPVDNSTTPPNTLTLGSPSSRAALDSKPQPRVDGGAPVQVPRYLMSTVPKGDYAMVVPPIKNHFVVASAPRVQWIVHQCHGVCSGDLPTGWINCQAEMAQFAYEAMVASGGSRAGQLIAAQYKNGKCEQSDGSPLFFWKEDNPDYGLVR